MRKGIIVVGMLLIGCDTQGGPSQAPPSTSSCNGTPQQIAYQKLVRDADTLKDTVVDFSGKVFQYDTHTGRDHFLMSVTNSGYGFYSDNVLVDLPDPSIADNVYKDTLVHITAAVRGTYTYKNALNADVTVPELQACTVSVLPSPSPT